MVRIAPLLLVLVLTACAPAEKAATANSAPAVEANPAPANVVPMSSLNASLALEALNHDREVQPGADETFDFKLVNHMTQPVPVVFVLEHAGGERWRTSLCVENQCLLGDGSEPSVSDPVLLPPYLEQPFQAHVFVDKSAKAGHSTALTLRVEPQVAGIEPQSLTLNARLAAGQTP